MIESSDEPSISMTRLYCNGDTISSLTGFSIPVGVHCGSRDIIGFELSAGLKIDFFFEVFSVLILAFSALLRSIFTLFLYHGQRLEAKHGTKLRRRSNLDSSTYLEAMS